MANIASKEDYTWIERANCVGLLHLFYGHLSERPQSMAKRESKAALICAKCEVFDDCRNYARKNKELGYWAGENEYDRALAGYAPVGIPLRKSTLLYHDRKSQ